ncbi:hypothetical protein WN944_010698 [Citrus x changshan-huyou]|uniref:Uncharacterized protein n=1 Tax=Citrus x changshan-huyou TaxID=2935761 RepID=A0AAP0MS47_9ROSI
MSIGNLKDFLKELDGTGDEFKIFYMNNVECCENVYRGSSLPLIIAWNEEEIKKFMRWLKKQDNVNSEKVRLHDSGNVGSSCQVPVDIAQLLQRITK